MSHFAFPLDFLRPGVPAILRTLSVKRCLIFAPCNLSSVPDISPSFIDLSSLFTLPDNFLHGGIDINKISCQRNEKISLLLCELPPEPGRVNINRSQGVCYGWRYGWSWVEKPQYLLTRSLLGKEAL